MAAQYFFENGLRKVRPYYFAHKTNCKGRWFGRTVLDVFSTEFRDRSRLYYSEQIKNGNFKILTRSGVTVQQDALLEYQINNGDVLEYSSHQHEPVVPKASVNIIFQDELIVVVDKPSGIPVHPTQKYYYNSVTEIVKSEHGLQSIYPCHRLDKLTSGVLILSKTNTASSSIQQAIQNKEDVEKLYLARVDGKFPEGEVICDDPVVNIQTKKAFFNGKPEAKHACTVFKRINYNSTLDQSIVECQPVTGRTHQIRIHLRNLGHPICNDPLYGKKGLLHTASPDIDESEFNNLVARATENREALISEDACAECGNLLYKDYLANDLILWLHSLRYKVGGKVFETAKPEWSNISSSSLLF